MENIRQNLRVQKIIAVVSILLFSIKIIAWYLTNSIAILTDALESIVNVLAGLLGVYSLIVSARPKDEDHLYGHGKVEFISSGVEGTLIIIAGAFIIYKSIINFNGESSVQKLDYGLILLGFTAIANWFAGTVCVKTGKKNNSLVLIASGKHLQSDTYTTIGILVGLLLMLIFNFQWIDGVVAIIFACIIIYTGFKIIRTSVAGIMDETDILLLSKIVQTLNSNRRDNWMDIHNLRIIKYGSTLHLDCHLTVPWYFNVNEAHFEVEALTTLMRENYGESVEMFIHTDGCLNSSCAICLKKGCPVRQQPLERKIEWTIKNISNNHKHNVSTK